MVGRMTYEVAGMMTYEMAGRMTYEVRVSLAQLSL